MLKTERVLIMLFALLIFFSGCIEQNNNLPGEEIKEIMVEGHGNQIYRFSFDIRESLKIASNDPAGIKELFSNSNAFIIVFDGSSEEDNAYFTVVLINTIDKMQTFASYEGELIFFDTLYYEGEQWYNRTGGEIEQPDFVDPVIWLLGPSTGATETSVNREGNIIYIQGTTYENLVKAADKFSLIFMGVEKVEGCCGCSR